MKISKIAKLVKDAGCVQLDSFAASMEKVRPVGA